MTPSFFAYSEKKVAATDEKGAPSLTPGDRLINGFEPLLDRMDRHTMLMAWRS